MTHLSKPAEFDTVHQSSSDCPCPCSTFPASTTCSTTTASSYLERFGKGTQGAGWHSFDQDGVHFVGLVNVMNLKAGGLGIARRRPARLAGEGRQAPPSSTPIVVFAHIPLWTVYPEWGWGTDDSEQALSLPEAVRLGHRAERPHPPGHAEGRGTSPSTPRCPPRSRSRRQAPRLARPDEGGRRSAAQAARSYADVIARRELIRSQLPTATRSGSSPRTSATSRSTTSASRPGRRRCRSARRSPGRTGRHPAHRRQHRAGVQVACAGYRRQFSHRFERRHLRVLLLDSSEDDGTGGTSGEASASHHHYKRTLSSCYLLVAAVAAVPFFAVAACGSSYRLGAHRSDHAPPAARS